MRADIAPPTPEIRLPPDCDAVEVQAFFRGTLIASRCLHPRHRKSRRFVIGSAKGADAPAAQDCLGEDQHTLLRLEPRGFTVALAGSMSGRALVQDRTVPFAELATDANGDRIAPADARLELACGEVAFTVRATSSPPVIPRPSIVRRQLHSPTAAALVATLLCAALLAFVPPDPKALSFDTFMASHRWLPTTIIVPKPPLPPTARGTTLVLDRNPGPGSSGSAPSRKVRHTGPTTAAARPHEQAPQAVGRAGILGILSGAHGKLWRSIFAADSSLSATAEDSLRGLQAVDLASTLNDGGFHGIVEGAPGPGLAGTGPQRLVPGTIGDCDARCQEAQRLGLPGPGRLARKTIRVPEFEASPVVLRGVLDREIVRRVIRRHLNEIRYCYERELPRRPELAGRIVVTFTIAPQGRVMAAARDSSTMSDAAVESCVVQAVQRWDFPQPKNGGPVIVSYPFVFVPAAS